MDTLQYTEPPRRWRKLGATLLALLALGWLATLLLRPSQPGPARAQPPRITQVMLPPPPPPPKPEPESPKPQQQPRPLQAAEPTPQPKPDAEQTPPGDPLTAPAGPGDNAFGLQAGDGGGTMIGGKGGGGGPFASYAASVQRAVQQLLQRDERTRKGRYSATVAVWLNPDGSIGRLQILSSAGKPELDAAIVRALQDQPLPQPPPASLPQPIQLRIGALAPG
ncbi:TonB family protein [Xanthomonas theicola]|nr:TonB family protein [Xanthomonas theicola]QNH25863.1 TonB C-terminal domain-containing protein [Xanthomonas theicola]